MRRAVLLPLVVLLGCYGQPTLQPAGTDHENENRSAERASGRVTPEAARPQDGRQDGARNENEVEIEVAERGGQPLVASEAGVSTAQETRVAEIGLVLAKLEAIDPDTPKDRRPGAGQWRAAELEKLAELVGRSCDVGPGACRGALEPIATARLPADELWELYGQFLGPLRPRAEEGVAVLGRELMLRDQPIVRDRAFRLAVGSGAAVRGEPGGPDGEHRASAVPQHAGLGEPVLVVVERVASCDKIVPDLKGPDAAGRFDLDFALDCPEPEPPPPDSEPIAARVVWAFDAGPLPESGLSLWIRGSDEAPLLTVAPPATAKRQDSEEQDEPDGE